MLHWRKFSTTENSNGYISLLLLYTGCTGCKRNICAPNFIITSSIYDIQWGKQHTPCVRLKDRDNNGYMTNSWNSAQLHVFLCDTQGVTTHNEAIKTWWKPQPNSLGQRPCVSNGLPLCNSPSVRRWDWAQILKLSRLQFKAGSGSSTSLSAEQ